MKADYVFVMTIQEDVNQKERIVLELLTKRALTPGDISTWAVVSLEETAIVTSSLLRKGLIMQMSDGFSTFFYITGKGIEVLRSTAGSFENKGPSKTKHLE
jgi:predicted transcriptional regulator